MRATLARLALPPDYVQALTADEAARAAGLPLQHPAWFYPSGGWVEPAAFARSLLASGGARVQWRGGVEVASLCRSASGWQLLATDGRVIDDCEVVVLANAGDALRLLGRPAWPVTAVRGQISVAPQALAAQARLPIAGSGYLLPPHEGRVVFGATSQPGDADASVRPADHLHNLAQLSRLLGRESGFDPAALSGRTGWRWSSDDRLPIAGAVPDDAAAALAPSRLDQPRFVPRREGLFVVSALGSRGITWSVLCARVVAAQIAGSPSPLEASLLDAIDPARFIARAVRRPAGAG